jgi:hypothetical protein
MEIIQFKPAKGLLDFDGIGIKIDVEKQRKYWSAAFADVQTAVHFCNLNYVEAEEMVREFIAADILDPAGSHWTDTVEYLEAIVEIKGGPCPA